MDLTGIQGKFKSYKVVLEPDENTPEWWAGAPSVVLDKSGTFWLAARMREGNSPRGRRGYEVRILRSDDGISFQHAHSIKREDVPIRGFERPAITIDPKTGKFKLYACGPFGDDDYHPWCILKFDDADDPTKFKPETCYAVLKPSKKALEQRSNAIAGYKDPFIFIHNGIYHMFTIAYSRMERSYHYISEDGETWKPAENELTFDLCGWHNFFTRPASILPLGVGYLLIYEGSHSSWYDPVYNIVTGLAYTFDLENFIDLTPDAPLLKSTTPGDYITWRYSHWMWINGKIMIYAEVARPNNSNEIRLFVIDNL
ncbi:hypothetical protein GF312_00255 [Candidatus Poribacteria bacterium]|nr:hypothetical protein [Candidatus Poribacteria bacterium]